MEGLATFSLQESRGRSGHGLPGWRKEGVLELGLKTCLELKQAVMDGKGTPEHSPHSVTETAISE